MPAVSTSFGEGVWGINSDETGFVIESISMDFSNSKGQLKNRTGNTNGTTYYDEMVSISLTGKIPKTAPFSATLASATTLSNSLSAYPFLKGGNSGLLIVEGVTIDLGQESYQGISVQIVNHPNITA